MMLKRKVLCLSGLTILIAAASAQASEVQLRALMEDVPETQIIEAMLPQFEKESGIKVQFEKIGYGDMHDKLVSQLISPQSYYNLLSVDFLWAGEFPAAGWLSDLSPQIKATNYDLNAFIPSTLSLLNHDSNKLYILPMYNYSMGMIYRTDLLQSAPLQQQYQQSNGRPLALPTTLEEYVALSKFMKSNAKVAGAAMQGQRGDPNSMEFSNYLFAAGGEYLTPEGKVALNSPEGKNALRLYVDNIQNGAQTGALSATLDDTMRLMCSGKAFSMITYWWMLPQLDNAQKCPEIAGKVALINMPGGHGESGGWGWGIPANVTPQEKEAAWTFIQWVQSKKVATARALEGHAPVRADVYNDPAVLAKYPYYRTAQEVVAKGKSFPIFAYSAQYEDVLGTQLSQVAGGKGSVDQALAESAEQLEKLLKK